MNLLYITKVAKNYIDFFLNLHYKLKPSRMVIINVELFYFYNRFYCTCNEDNIFEALLAFGLDVFLEFYCLILV